MAEIRKISQRMLGSEGKMVLFWWIAKRIAIHGENMTWIVGDSQQINKGTLNFEDKAWWTLARYRLYPTIGDNVLILVQAAMIVSFTTSYEFDMGEFLV